MNTDTPAPYFKRHIFFCLNDRSNGENCCAQQFSPLLRSLRQKKMCRLKYGAGVSVFMPGF